MPKGSKKKEGSTRKTEATRPLGVAATNNEKKKGPTLDTCLKDRDRFTHNAVKLACEVLVKAISAGERVAKKRVAIPEKHRVLFTEIVEEFTGALRIAWQEQLRIFGGK